MKVKDLIIALQKRDQNAEVEAIVVTTAGEIFVMYIQAKAGDIIKTLKLFKK